MTSPSPDAGLNIPTLDLAIIVVYLLGIMAVGMWSVRRQKLSGETYFLAGRSLRWPMIGATLFASNISTQSRRYSSIFEAINPIAACLAPPITVCFIGDVFGGEELYRLLSH